LRPGSEFQSVDQTIQIIEGIIRIFYRASSQTPITEDTWHNRRKRHFDPLWKARIQTNICACPIH
jgi:hypothetical protein